MSEKPWFTTVGNYNWNHHLGKFNFYSGTPTCLPPLFPGGVSAPGTRVTGHEDRLDLLDRLGDSRNVETEIFTFNVTEDLWLSNESVKRNTTSHHNMFWMVERCVGMEFL